MPISPKEWVDEPDLLRVLMGEVDPSSDTPIDAASQIDQEERVTAYSDGYADAAAAAAVSAHTSDTSAAHAASAISYGGGAGTAATDVEGALDELSTEKANTTDLADHISDSSAAHAASAISYGGASGISATDAEGAIDELAAEKANSADILTPAQEVDRFGRSSKLAGSYAPWPQIGYTAALTLGALPGYALFGRFVPSRDMTISIISFYVSAAATANDACDVGIYDSSGTRLVSKGATTGLLNSLGPKDASIAATALTAGNVYYGAFSAAAPGGTAASIVMANNGAYCGMFGGTPPNFDSGFKAASHPLPAPMGGLSSTGIAAFLALRE